MAVIWLPWAFKLLYGLITDSFPIFGSSKKSYIILCGFLQALTNLMIATYKGRNPEYIVFLATMGQVCVGLIDVVVDGLMVIASREDADSGSEDL